MATETTNTSIPPDVLADVLAVVDSLNGGKPLDPEVARRIQERSEQARQDLRTAQGVQDVGVQIIREMRGPLDEGRELTLSQRALLHAGDARLVDPDTGASYVLVRADEYQRLHNR